VDGRRGPLVLEVASLAIPLIVSAFATLPHAERRLVR
jgi:hypothetical protein